MDILRAIFKFRLKYGALGSSTACVTEQYVEYLYNQN